MSDLLLTLGSLTLPLIAGWLFLHNLFTEHKPFFLLERIFLSLGLGWGFVTLAMLYMSFLNIHFTVPGIAIFTLILASAACLLIRKSLPHPPLSAPLTENLRRASAPLNLLEIGLLVLIAGATLFLFFETLMVFNMWDSWAVWGFKSKIFFVDKIIPLEKFAQFRQTWGNWDYPQHATLAGTWVFLCLGYWNDRWYLIIFPLFHLGLAVCIYSYVRRQVDRVTALAGTFCLLTIPGLFIVTIGPVCEPILLFYYILSLIFLLEWRVTEDDRYFLLSAIFVGLGAWTKNEGMAYGISNLIVIYLMLGKDSIQKAQRFRSMLQYAGIIAAIIFPWWAFKSCLGLSNILINPEHLSRQVFFGNLFAANPTLAKLPHIFLDLNNYNLAWLMFLCFLVLSWRSLGKAPYIYLLISMIFNIFLVIFFSILDLTQQYSQDTYHRLLLAPTIFALLFVLLQQRKTSLE